MAGQRGARPFHAGATSHQNSREFSDGQGPAEDAEIEAYFIQTGQVARAKGADEANAY